MLRFSPVAKRIASVVLLILILQCVLYAGIVSNQYYHLTKSHDRYGLEVVSTINPVGVGEYVESRKPDGRCFSDYLTSSYLLWKLQPDFKTFIDLRDLDVFPPEFFADFAEAVTFPEKFNALDSAHRFQYVILYRPQFANLHAYLYSDSAFSLKYLDAVAAVYERGNPREKTSPAIFTHSKPVQLNESSLIFSKIFNPFYSPFNYSVVNYDVLAASYFLSVNDLERAESYATRGLKSDSDKHESLNTIAELNYRKALNTGEGQQRSDLLMKAGSFYQQSLNEKENAAAFYGLGAVYYQQKNFNAAIEHFDQAIDDDPQHLNALLFAAECAKYFVNLNNAESVDYLDRTIRYYARADRLNPDNPNIQLNLGFLYFRKNDCKRATHYLQKVVGFDGLLPEQRNQAKDCLIKCGSAI